jgi:uncharacterized PurR-regulated membrane protein YhhQ (DUF165 family)
MLPDLLLRKIVYIPMVGALPFDIFFTGVYFVILDIVTEVYGVKESRKLLLAGLISYSIFILVMEISLRIPSPKINLTYYKLTDILMAESSYRFLFQNVYTVWLSVIVCVSISGWLNMVVLSKWKILMKGKYFWIRSPVTSFIAALIYSSISNLSAVGILMHPSNPITIFQVMGFSFAAKLFTFIIFAYPATKICEYLKSKEKIDVYDYGISFNPLQKL